LARFRLYIDDERFDSKKEKVKRDARGYVLSLGLIKMALNI